MRRVSLNPTMSLTVAIPTFQRPEAVLHFLTELSKEDVSSDFLILIAISGSQDESYKAVKDFSSRFASVKILHFEDDLGFSRNFLRLLSHVRTNFVLTLSDEDSIEFHHLWRILELLVHNDPALIFLRNSGEASFSIKKLKTSQVRGFSNYMSGIVFNMNLAKNILGELEHLSDAEEFAYLYPHVLLSFFLFCKGPSFVLSRPKIVHHLTLSSSILSRRGEPYWFPTERVYQYVSMLKCLATIEQKMSKREQKMLDRIRRSQKKFFFGSILDSVDSISPDVTSHFTRSSFRTAFLFEIKKFRRH